MKRLAVVSLLTVALVLLMSSAALAATNLVVNGGFESGDTDFTTEHHSYTDGADLHAPQTYAIGANPRDFHSAWFSFGPQSGSLMMIVNAAEAPDVEVWGQTVPVLPGHVYQWDAWVRASYLQNPAELVFLAANGVPVITTMVDENAWTKVTGYWTCPLGVTSVNLSIVDNTHEYSGDDYVIDSIAFYDVGSTYGKATGGIKFMAGTTEVQLEFVAMAGSSGAKGVVNYRASNGNEFTGKVTGYLQNSDGTIACFVGAITKTNHADWDYFLVAVTDNGEGVNDPADHGGRVLCGSSPYVPGISYAAGLDVFTGNVQIH